MVQECSVYGRVSDAFSIISCTSWIFAQLPQILTNYRLKSASGISPSFLILWFMGDFLSFTSCLFNDATLGFQLYLSIFFLCNDVTLCFQYYYYHSEDGAFEHEAEERYSSLEPTPEVFGPRADLSVHAHAQGSDIRRVHPETLSDDSAPSSYNSTDDNSSVMKTFVAAVATNAGKASAISLGSNLNLQTREYSTRDQLGLFLAWGCTVVYCASRCPQLYKNYKRKSVEGISPLLFGAALLGNLSYTLSILSSCSFVYGNRAEFINKELPYILGSSGTIVFDLLYFYQKHLYRTGGSQATAIRLQRWRDVEHGTMTPH
ncbi:uncharacterized protein LODBEIA_P33720 [Lodderomyces beijingensis]|uniref:Uncharacterized protein n=1 Tax=Lodderomyces beijingensis TaxID=1775926 RepID=A0ABP0ZLV6_9ASCO